MTDRVRELVQDLEQPTLALASPWAVAFVLGAVVFGGAAAAGCLVWTLIAR